MAITVTLVQRTSVITIGDVIDLGEYLAEISI